ncbi:unnamed protein product, partial [Effrenium voratum]
ASILGAIEEFAKKNRWLKVAAGQKAEILEVTVQEGDRVLEIGTYVGYTSLRLAQQGCKVVTLEADPLNAAVAQRVVDLAGARDRVDVRVGRAADWLSSGRLSDIDVLILDHRGTVYHEDLAKAEPLLSSKARVVADNVLHPGAPLFLVDVQDRYHVEVHVLEEFGMDLEDWLLVCRPKTWPVAKGAAVASQQFAAMRRWAAEVNRLCHESQAGPVDWQDLQARMKPALQDVMQECIWKENSKNRWPESMLITCSKRGV